jgi:guanylate kinase
VILVVSGPGGVGKGTIVGRLLEMDPDLWLSRSWTTRQRRPSEAEDAYVFVDRDTFVRRRNAGGFLEWNEFPGNGQLYGTPTLEPGADQDVVLEIELNGARQVKQLHPEAVVVFVVAPSREVQAARLRARGDDEMSVARRLQLAEDEEIEGRLIADHVVVNDDVERAAREVVGILDARRAGSS